MKCSLPLCVPRILFSLFLAGLWLYPNSASCQDSGDEGTISRGEFAEISVTVRDNSGQPITTSATVKLSKNGIPIDQSTSSHGRAFFVPHSLGDFSISVDAAGFKPAQKDISLSVPVKAEIDIYLQAENASNVSVGVPGKPVLAPKAKEALVKAIQALGEDKLDQAQKHMNEVMKLAPGHPEVLYVQGMLDLKRAKWADAETSLEKANELDPGQARILSALGMALCNQKKYDQAIPPLEKSLQLAPAAAWETQATLTKAYYYQGQYEQALKLAEQAHAQTQGSAPQVELLLAQCLTAVGRYEDSAQVLREFLKNNPNGPDSATARRWLDGLAANGKIPPTSSPSP
jgi:outer membrane protein assembly factor BamD (BamD/ComL family)